ncbi:MAG: MBL fold metallo-hydrolase [Cyanobacteria bacterium REEB444]|nr:MBL fold metallo-hydrolase [Cyanobacteria bacterium REEB444]
MYFTWLDSNSWLIELGEKRILVDPWLVGPLTFGRSAWLFKSDRPHPRPIPDHLDLILLSQGLPDHAHQPTLKQLDRHIPVIASINGANVVNQLGYTQVTPLTHGQSVEFSHRLHIQAVPGSLVGPNTIENGYILRDQLTQDSVYYEPHGFHSSSLKQMDPVTVVITPVVNLVLPFGITPIQGYHSGLEIAQWLKPQFILPTAAGGDVEMTGLAMTLVRAVGGAAELQTVLRANHLPTLVLEPKPGERFQLPY